MRKLNLLSTLLILSLALVSCDKSNNDNTNISNTTSNEETTNIITYTIDDKYSLDNYIDNLINETPSYVPSWNKESFKGRWNYIDGVFLNSIIEYSKIKKDNKYMDFVEDYVNYYINDNGEFLYIADKNNYEPTTENAFRKAELDSFCESRILFDLYDYTNDKRYLNAIEASYNYLLEMPICSNNINYCHKSIYNNQIYLDGFYMYVPFLARYAKYKKNNQIFDNIINQYKYVYENQRNKDNGLYYHCMDVSKLIFWADKETGVSKSVWTRSLGWFMMSIVDSLEYFPSDKQIDLINILKEGLESIYKYMDKNSKMYYQLTDKGNVSYNVSYDKYLKYLNKNYKKDAVISNYLESSGSSMIAYTMIKAAKNDYIDNKYLNIGIDTFIGTYNHSFNKNTNTLNDICITAGLGPEDKIYRDGTPEYYLAEPVGSNDAKGVGPFVMSYIEYIK